MESTGLPTADLPSTTTTATETPARIDSTSRQSPPLTDLTIADLQSEVRRKGVALPHDRQAFHWDCGISCLRMVLKYFGKNEKGQLSGHFLALGLKTSIWTIDLAYLLTRFGVGMRMSTLTLGVDKNYAGVDFYSGHLNEDDLRVNKMFREAQSAGVTVVQEGVTMETITRHLESRRVILILIDWKKLGCLHCSPRRRSIFRNNYAEEKGNRGYQGHFICLTGFDKERNLIYFSNPAADLPVCVCNAEDLDRARKSYGTDEDIIFVDDRLSTIGA